MYPLRGVAGEFVVEGWFGGAISVAKGVRTGGVDWGFNRTWRFNINCVLYGDKHLVGTGTTSQTQLLSNLHSVPLHLHLVQSIPMSFDRKRKDPQQPISEALKKEVNDAVEDCKLAKTCCCCVPSNVSETPGLQYAHCLSRPITKSLACFYLH